MSEDEMLPNPYVETLRQENSKLRARVERLTDALDYECSQHANPCDCELCKTLTDCEEKDG